MKKGRNKFSLLIFLILAIVCAIIIFFGIRMYRSDKKKAFDNMLNSEMVLKVSYGEISRHHVLKETNNLLPRTNQKNNAYLYITKDRHVFAYYLDWYYKIDPMEGIKLEYEKDITKSDLNNLIESLKEKVIEKTYENNNKYLEIRLEDKNYFIDQNDLQTILQNSEIFYNPDNGDNYEQ